MKNRNEQQQTQIPCGNDRKKSARRENSSRALLKTHLDDQCSLVAEVR